MNNRIYKELFCRLFVIAVQNKMHLTAFTYHLERSAFIKKLEAQIYDEYFNKSLEDIFFDVTGVKILKDESYGIYNDAYWCGYIYYDLFVKTNKSFVYLFLKLPLKKLIDMYPVYHEMDFSNLYEYFKEVEQKKTILRLLCERYNSSLPKISESTGISLSTLSKYNEDDEYLYKGSFQYIFRIAEFFNVPVTLFLTSLNIDNVSIKK